MPACLLELWVDQNPTDIIDIALRDNDRSHADLNVPGFGVRTAVLVGDAVGRREHVPARHNDAAAQRTAVQVNAHLCKERDQRINNIEEQ